MSNIEKLKTDEATTQVFMLALCELLDYIKNVKGQYPIGPAIHKLFNSWPDKSRTDDEATIEFADYVREQALEFAKDVQTMRSGSASRFSVPRNNKISEIIGGHNGQQATEHLLQLDRTVNQCLNTYRLNRKEASAVSLIGDCKTPVTEPTEAVTA